MLVLVLVLVVVGRRRWWCWPAAKAVVLSHTIIVRIQGLAGIRVRRPCTLSLKHRSSVFFFVFLLFLLHLYSVVGLVLAQCDMFKTSTFSGLEF